jgi:hypothetical protein
MALQFVAPPPQVYSAYQQSLLDFLGPQPAAVQEYHLPVGALGHVELAAGATLADAVPSGSRFLASWSDGTWTSCEMTNPALDGTAEFRNFIAGDFGQQAFALIAQAQGLEALQSEAYDLHFLSIPGIYLEALHLVRQGLVRQGSVQNQSGGDLVLPLISIDAQFSLGAVFDEAAFLAIARASAAARLKKASTDPLSS